MPTLVTNKCCICGSDFTTTFKKRNQKTCSKSCSYKLRQETRQAQHEPTKKFCISCNQEFDDISKKKLVKKCDECIIKEGVAKRMERGSYARTTEQNNKLSESLKEKYSSGWNPNTPEHKEKLSHLMKERWETGKMGEMTKIKCQEKYGVNHHSQRLEFIDLQSKFSYAKSGFREDINLKVRSAWEANFARFLTFIGKKWLYEPKRFFLKSGKSYLPDFYLPEENLYYEVKGFWKDESRKKVADAISEFNLKLVVIELEQYNNIAREFSHLIPNWEF